MTREDFEKIADNLIAYAEDMHARMTEALVTAFNQGVEVAAGEADHHPWPHRAAIGFWGIERASIGNAAREKKIAPMNDQQRAGK